MHDRAADNSRPLIADPCGHAWADKLVRRPSRGYPWRISAELGGPTQWLRPFHGHTNHYWTPSAAQSTEAHGGRAQFSQDQRSRKREARVEATRQGRP